MYKLYAFWSAPNDEDIQAFEKHYAEVHLPLALAVPNLTGLVESQTGDSFEGAPPLHYRIAEMIFDDQKGFLESTESPEWAAMRADSGHIIETFGVELTVAMGAPEEAM